MRMELYHDQIEARGRAIAQEIVEASTTPGRQRALALAITPGATAEAGVGVMARLLRIEPHIDFYVDSAVGADGSQVRPRAEGLRVMLTHIRDTPPPSGWPDIERVKQQLMRDIAARELASLPPVGAPLPGIDPDPEPSASEPVS